MLLAMTYDEAQQNNVIARKPNGREADVAIWFFLFPTSNPVERTRYVSKSRGFFTRASGAGNKTAIHRVYDTGYARARGRKGSDVC